MKHSKVVSLFSTGSSSEFQTLSTLLETHHRFVDAYHVEHWANGGETPLHNLVLLCRHHHRLVHEGGFSVERIADGVIRFTRADGRVIEEHPQLPASRGIESTLDTDKPPIGASDWIVPEGRTDPDLVFSGLARLEEKQRSLVERPS